MNKEFKVRLICFVIGVFLIGGSYYLSGEWRNEYVGDSDGYYPGKPIFEKDLITESCGPNCTFVKLDTTLLLGLIGTMIGMVSICPIKLTNDANVGEGVA